jgi:hypothetical protein
MQSALDHAGRAAPPSTYAFHVGDEHIWLLSPLRDSPSSAMARRRIQPTPHSPAHPMTSLRLLPEPHSATSMPSMSATTTDSFGCSSYSKSLLRLLDRLSLRGFPLFARLITP